MCLLSIIGLCHKHFERHVFAGICSQCCGGYYYDVGDCYPCTTCQDGVGPQAECVKDGTSNDCPSHNLDKVVSPSACISLVPTTKAPLTGPMKLTFQVFLNTILGIRCYR